MNTVAGLNYSLRGILPSGATNTAIGINVRDAGIPHREKATRTSILVAAIAIVPATLIFVDMPVSGQSSVTSAVDKAVVEKYLTAWKQKPREVAKTMIGKYGPASPGTNHIAGARAHGMESN